MPPKKNPARSGCPVANALDLLGDRWTLIVLRDLIFFGRREFGQFLGAGEGIATNILTDRLEKLCRSGLVARFDHPADGKKYVYRVTEMGLDLVPTMIELILWSASHLPAVKAPAESLHPLKHDRENFIRTLRAGLLAEFKAAGKPLPPPPCK
ncbi:MAG: helix-turn-helix transcriptional regulator [Opitutae bacterium]|nr:helix-turn-helix transcriptional regulator [Opitutae bacterium]